MKTVTLALLMFDILRCSYGEFTLRVPVGVISAKVGSSVLLPCESSKALDIGTYEIRWYQKMKDEKTVLLYKGQQVQEDAGDPQYRGRASLIGELQKGNASLKLENLTLKDSGEYVCYVKSEDWYDTAKVTLTITVVGSPLLLSLAAAGDKFNVSCRSAGWSPQPTLTWRNKEGKQLENSVDYYRTDSEGLVSVSSWLVSSPSNSEWVSCSVGLSDKEIKEGRILTLKTSCTTPESGWKAFIVLLVITLLVFTILGIFIIFKIRGTISPKGPTFAEQGHHSLLAAPLIGQVSAQTNLSTADKFTPTSASEKATNTEFADWGMMLTHKVAIMPDESTTRFVEFEKKGSKITCKSNADDNEPAHVLCKERIRSGQYYWEITALTEPPKSNTKNKKYLCPTSWYVGVTNKTAEKGKVALTPGNGYWVLHYEKEKGYFVNDPCLTPVLERECFSKLGVFLDCDKHKLSFYNCTEKSHLYTFYNLESTQPLIPVLNPGDKPNETIIICQEKCVKCNELYRTK
ncbi:butyrophilin subfamily 3 member A3-like [Hoplias malabaricus]|uniref:butyrophilin subfamily 3 member A3-like n=1 Tax=Hoplias malabaricus TaxID=27720 RepID=UPI0034635E82